LPWKSAAGFVAPDFFKAVVATAAPTIELVAHRVFPVVTLVVVLGGVKVLELENRCNDGLVKTPGLLEFLE